jgi:hypothetical protein
VFPPPDRLQPQPTTEAAAKDPAATRKRRRFTAVPL